MIILIGFAFLAGFVTIITPCIWPLLPIILSVTTTGGHRKPLGITLGIMVSFGFLTLALSYIVKLIPFDPNILRYFAVIVIGFLGITLLIPQLSSLLEAYVSRLSGKFSNKTGSPSIASAKDGLWSGFLTGLTLGIVWTPCAGPILATIATLAATRTVSIQLIVVTTAYVIGIGIPLFLFATVGRVLFTKAKLLNRYTGRVQQIFGIILILTAIAIFTNYDIYIENKLLDAFPQLNATLNGFESNSAITNQLNTLKGSTQQNAVDTSSLFNTNTPAPDFVGITKWLNLPNGQTSRALKDLRGKVVLVDFWTYTCINCIRTLPFVTSWYDKYKDQGFVVIGVHTPEFAFEHDTNNVLNAIKMYNIHYPVAQDNNYATWNNYANQYWPAEYLIDAQGNIRRTHFGEGEYDQMEMAIQTLLKEAGKTVNQKLDTMKDTTPQMELSPETYVGTNRMQYYYPGGTVSNGTNTFTLSDTIPTNTFTLGGQWTIDGENATAGINATLVYHFFAGKVFLVLRPPANASGTIKVLLDGKTVDANSAGSDVTNGIITVDSDRLYNLIDLKGNVGDHTLTLQFSTPGIQAFAFTFGQ